MASKPKKQAAPRSTPPTAQPTAPAFSELAAHYLERLQSRKLRPQRRTVERIAIHAALAWLKQEGSTHPDMVEWACYLESLHQRLGPSSAENARAIIVRVYRQCALLPAQGWAPIVNPFGTVPEQDKETTDSYLRSLSKDGTPRPPVIDAQTLGKLLSLRNHYLAQGSKGVAQATLMLRRQVLDNFMRWCSALAGGAL